MDGNDIALERSYEGGRALWECGVLGSQELGGKLSTRVVLSRACRGFHDMFLEWLDMHVFTFLVFLNISTGRSLMLASGFQFSHCLKGAVRSQ